MKKVAMIGVGKLGQDCAEVMAEHYDVIGYDIAPRNPSNFEMRASIKDAVSERDIIFIAAPTPHDPKYGGETPTSSLPNKDFDYTTVMDILTEVNKHVNRTQLVVLISTVLPGTVRKYLHRCITNARFIYNPYLIAMGTIKWDMVNPEMVIIGTEDGKVTGDAQELIDFYKVFMRNNPRYEVGTWDEAEAIKIFYNTFISTKLALVNMIQDVAEANGNMNVDVVTNALAKSNYRITGPAYMKAGLGDAGACHPRDNIALRYLAERLNLGYDLFDAIMSSRERQAERMAFRCLEEGRNVTIIGKAYKPGVPYTHGSASMLVGYYIEKHGGNVNYYDINTGDLDLKPTWTHVYLIGYWDEHIETLYFPWHVTVFDPWRQISPLKHVAATVLYGNTRSDALAPATIGHRPPSDMTEAITKDIRRVCNLDEDDIYVIFAGVTDEFSFMKRRVSDIVDEIITAYNNGKNKFIFNGSSEGVMAYVLAKIQCILSVLQNKIPVPIENYIYVNGSVNGNEVCEKLYRENDMEFRIPVISVNSFECGTQSQYSAFRFMGDYVPGPRNKKFLCFNKVARRHRIDFFEEMLKADLVDKSYYSFEGVTMPVFNEIEQERWPNIFKTLDKLPLRLNITNERANPVDITVDDLPYFEQSYFSVVTETVFYDLKKFHEICPSNPYSPYEHTLYFSEKIYKCMAVLHPFIIMAHHGALAELRRKGYKTFAPFIDESYDLIIDDDERFAAIVNEVKRLCSLPESALIDWTHQIKEILEHNRTVFFEQQNFINTTKTQTTSTVLPETPNKQIELVKLECGYNINVFDAGNDLDLQIRDELFAYVKKTGKNSYHKVIQIDSESGVLALELLGNNTCKFATFVNPKKNIVQNFIASANANGLAMAVQGYATNALNEVTDDVVSDLVLINANKLITADDDTVNKFVSDLTGIISGDAVLYIYGENITQGFIAKFIARGFGNVGVCRLLYAPTGRCIRLDASTVSFDPRGRGALFVSGVKVESDTVQPTENVNHEIQLEGINKSHSTIITGPNIPIPGLTVYNYDPAGSSFSVYVVPIVEPTTAGLEKLNCELSNNRKIVCPRHLNTDSNILALEVMNLIRDNGKPHYKNGFNWCSGIGTLCFEMLITNLCDHVTMADYYSEAINVATSNAEQLGLTSRITSYVSPVIKNLPNTEKWDLVLGYPPSSKDYGDYMNFMRSVAPDIPNGELMHYARSCVDHKLQAHKEFFLNASNFLNSGADIFIIENVPVPELIQWSTFLEIQYVDSYKLHTVSDRVLMHFKYIKNKGD